MEIEQKRVHRPTIPHLTCLHACVPVWYSRRIHPPAFADLDDLQVLYTALSRAVYYYECIGRISEKRHWKAETGSVTQQSVNMLVCFLFDYNSQERASSDGNLKCPGA